MDDDLTMLIGPGTDGRLLEISVLDLAGEDPVVIHDGAPTGVLSIPAVRGEQMPHIDDDIAEPARRFERLADDLDPATTTAEPIDDLRQIAAVSEAVRADEARLQKSVSIARAHDRSWNEIAIALGVSRQAARQRFSSKIEA